MPDDTLPQEKTCTRCGETKPVEAFHRNRRRKDGRQTCCKDCNNAQARAWERANRRRAAANRRKWDRDNPDRVLAMHRRRRKRNPQKAYARSLLNIAVAKGEINKPDHCQSCEKATPPGDLHGHHEDYSKPLEIEWLCRDCHASRHRDGPEI
jgi:hypothetical protein